MAMTGVLQAYDAPCTPQRNNSTDSFYQYGSDFGEGCLPESEAPKLYPVLTPVYNGRALDISPQFVHASLSGISIKHYYGKCSDADREKDEFAVDENFEEEEGEMEEYEWLEGRLEKPLSDLTESYASSYSEGQPLCTLPKMNFRNSFWNIHRPELCKLTWGQKYVSTATVTEHLHGHLVQHGPLCEGFHTEGERQSLLDKELDEYVRLKVLAPPRGLPPDEPFFSSIPDSERTLKFGDITLSETRVKFVYLTDDDEIAGKNIHRLKEEFCLTIGKHKREPPIVKSVESLVPESPLALRPTQAAEEEGGDSFYYDWHLNVAGETFEEQLDVGSSTQSVTFSETDSLAGPCPPLILDEFCKAAGKVDFSDMRCPDL